MEISRSIFRQKISPPSGGVMMPRLKAALRVGSRGDPNIPLVKWSKKRMVVSGETVELYLYEKPYFYNWGPEKKGVSEVLVVQEKKRDDHILRARRQIRRLVNANTASEVPKFITFTFKENVKTLREANPVWTRFQKEFQRRFGRGRYLCVPEFQERGAVHFHVIYFDLPYIKGLKSKVAKLWGRGFVKVVAVRQIRNVGAYVSKYLQKGVGDRRSLGQKAYFCSRGMQKPEEMRDESLIDNRLSSYILETEAVDSFDSRNGRIIYKRLRICSKERQISSVRA